jgi:hypothetical protein
MLHLRYSTAIEGLPEKESRILREIRAYYHPPARNKTVGVNAFDEARIRACG